MNGNCLCMGTVISDKILGDAHLIFDFQLLLLTSGIYQQLMSVSLGIISVISLHIPFLKETVG